MSDHNGRDEWEPRGYAFLVLLRANFVSVGTEEHVTAHVLQT